jgi:hypothetical protein
VLGVSRLGLARPVEQLHRTAALRFNDVRAGHACVACAPCSPGLQLMALPPSAGPVEGAPAQQPVLCWKVVPLDASGEAAVTVRIPSVGRYRHEKAPRRPRARHRLL